MKNEHAIERLNNSDANSKQMLPSTGHWHHDMYNTGIRLGT